MNKITICCAIFPFLLMSCNSIDNLVQYSALNESLQNANRSVYHSNQIIYDEMEQKLNDAQTRAKAQIWQPKAMEVKKMSSNIREFIDKLIIDLRKSTSADSNTSKNGDIEADKKSVKLLFEEQGEAAELYQKLFNYKKSVIAVIKPDEFADNPSMQQHLKQQADEFKKSLLTDADSIPVNSKNSLTRKENLIPSYFKNTTAIGAIVMLNKIQNDILRTENTLITYFDVNAKSSFDGYNVYKPLLSQNSSILKAGQTLEINAGIGAFSEAARPKITINGINIPTTDGVSTYSFKIKDKPGKYLIPVKIEFIRPDGSPGIIKENLRYIIKE